MLVFGGYEFSNYKNQISTVENCGLNRIGSLPAEFDWGACNTFEDSSEYVLLCFGTYPYFTGCHKYVYDNVLRRGELMIGVS